MKGIINKPTYLTLIGVVMLLFGSMIAGFILFALVAAVLDENLLERNEGLTLLGGIVYYLPYAASIILIIYDLFLRKKSVNANKFPLRKFGFITAIVGVLLALAGYISLLTYDQDKGANIGAGFLIFSGGFIFIIGFLATLLDFVNTIPRKQK